MGREYRITLVAALLLAPSSLSFSAGQAWVIINEEVRTEECVGEPGDGIDLVAT